MDSLIYGMQYAVGFFLYFFYFWPKMHLRSFTNPYWHVISMAYEEMPGKRE